jgi:phenylacetate-CoA ligase
LLASRDSLPLLAWDLWRAGQGDERQVVARQQARFRSLVEHARRCSPFYADLYRNLPDGIESPEALPTVHRAQLMEAFDRWVTDPAATLVGASAHVDDLAMIGQPFLGRYRAWMTTGTSGEPGIFLNDGGALAVSRALALVRGWLPEMTLERGRRTLRQRARVATVLATNEHASGVGTIRANRRLLPWISDQVRAFSPQLPLDELVAGLNDYQPAELAGYSQTLVMLAQEQLSGRLRLRLALAACGGEWLAPAARALIREAFTCPVRETYAVTESGRLAFSCRFGTLHLNADWVLLEPVDADRRPVGASQESTLALLTNLANRVAPLIRYELDDVVSIGARTCGCNSPLPTVEVYGRRDEVLQLEAPDGRQVALSPRTVATLVGQVPGVARYQILQTGPAELSVRFEGRAGTVRKQVWAGIELDLGRFLARQGLTDPRLIARPELPRTDPRSGKYHKVWDARPDTGHSSR